MAASRPSNLIQYLRGALLPREGDHLTDGQLLERFLTQRDAAAFTALVRRHGPMVFGVCRRVLRDLHDAEDAFQATFLVFVRRAASVAPREAVGNWLYGVAHRTALGARRAAARRRDKERDVATIPRPEPAADDAWGELRPLLDEELSRLPDKYRLPVVLCDLEGRSRRDVAQQLQVPEGTLSSRLATARKKLADRLTRRGVTLTVASLGVLLSQNAAPACLPARLVGMAVHAALAAAAGEAVIVSAQVAALAEGVVRVMVMSKVKTVVLGMMLVGVAGVGGGDLAYRAYSADPNAVGIAQSAVPPPAADAKFRDVALDELRVLQTDVQSADEARKRLEAARRQAEKARLDAEMARAQLEAARAQLEAALRLGEAAQLEAVALERQLNARSARVEDKPRDEPARSGDELAKAKDVITKLQIEVEALRASNAAHREQMRVLNAEIVQARLRAKTTATTAEIEKQLERFKAEIEQLQKELARSKASGQDESKKP